MKYLLSFVNSPYYTDHNVNKEKGIVTIAVGFARKENGDIVADIFERADALMYANKKKMKEELNN